MICHCIVEYTFYDGASSIQIDFIKRKKGWDVKCLDMEFWFNSIDFPTQKDAEYFYNIVKL